MIGYLFDENTEDILLDALLATSANANMPFCAISINSAKEMLSGASAEVLTGTNGTIRKDYATLPPIVDCTFPISMKVVSQKYGADFVSALCQKTHVCVQRSVAKSHFPAFLYHFGLFEYAIPTYEIKNFGDLQKAVTFFPNAILKPAGGRMGARVFHLREESDGTLVIVKEGKSELLSEEVFNTFLNETKQAFMGNALLQPYMDFHLDDNHALAFKLLRHRDENGEWKDVGTYAMIGGDPVVANISMGGSFADANECVQIIANKKADELYDKIDSLGFAVAKGIESLYGTDAYCLGIDIAVERKTLQPYVIEANTYPLAKRFVPAIAKQRLSYYKYLQKAYDV